jgi:hypothetical protein
MPLFGKKKKTGKIPHEAGFWTKSGQQIPLKDVNATVNVIDLIAHVEVRQTFKNYSLKPIEALYSVLRCYEELISSLL